MAVMEKDEAKLEKMVKESMKVLGEAFFKAEIHGYVEFEKMQRHFLERKHRVDVFVLPASVEGFEFGEKLRKVDRSCAIIYRAESIEPVLGAFASTPSAYIIDEEAYLTTLVRVASYVADGISYAMVLTKEKILRLSFEKINYFEASDNHMVKVVFRDGASDYYGYTLQRVESEIFGSFSKCHRSYLVNLENVSEVDRKNREVKFHSGQSLFASKIYFSSFCSAYDKYSIRKEN
jgi:two-component system response regulator AgrA